MITSKQAKQARGFCGLSQSRVVSATGINRSYISKFENGHMLLPDTENATLEKYYQELGWIEDNNLTPIPSKIIRQQRPVFFDGIQVPDNFNEPYVEELIQELHNNNKLIAEIADKPTPIKQASFGFGDDTANAEEVKKDVTNLINFMARNYCIVRELQGYECLLKLPSTVNESISTEDEPESRILPTIRDYLSLSFGDWPFQEATEHHQNTSMAYGIEPIF